MRFFSDDFSGQSVNISAFFPYTLLPESRNSYWRYNGSLTTPFCNESVIWTVFTSAVSVSHEQVCKAIHFTQLKISLTFGQLIGQLNYIDHGPLSPFHLTGHPFLTDPSCLVLLGRGWG